MSSLINYLCLFGLIGLAYMAVLFSWVKKQDAGDEKMKGIASNIAEGAMAFLTAEYKILAVFVLIAGGLLGFLSTQVETTHWFIVIAFVIAAPLAYWMMQQWLNDFSYKIEPSIWIFVFTGAGTLITAILITSYHSIKAALTNPVEVLKDE